MIIHRAETKQNHSTRRNWNRLIIAPKKCRIIVATKLFKVFTAPKIFKVFNAPKFFKVFFALKNFKVFKASKFPINNQKASVFKNQLRNYQSKSAKYRTQNSKSILFKQKLMWVQINNIIRWRNNWHNAGNHKIELTSAPLWNWNFIPIIYPGGNWKCWNNLQHLPLSHIPLNCSISSTSSIHWWFLLNLNNPTFRLLNYKIIV